MLNPLAPVVSSGHAIQSIVSYISGKPIRKAASKAWPRAPRSLTAHVNGDQKTDIDNQGKIMIRYQSLGLLSLKFEMASIDYF